MVRGYHGAFPLGLQSRLRHGAYRGHHTLGVQAKFEDVELKRSRVMPPQSRPKTSVRRVRKTIMTRAPRAPAVAPSHFKSPTAASRRPRRSYPSYHVLWPPALIQSSFWKSILTSCGGCPWRNGMRGTAEDFRSRCACLCMRLPAFIRLLTESASLNARSTSFHDPTSAPIVPGGNGLAGWSRADADSGRCRCGRR